MLLGHERTALSSSRRDLESSVGRDGERRQGCWSSPIRPQRGIDGANQGLVPVSPVRRWCLLRGATAPLRRGAAVRALVRRSRLRLGRGRSPLALQLRGRFASNERRLALGQRRPWRFLRRHVHAEFARLAALRGVGLGEWGLRHAGRNAPRGRGESQLHADDRIGAIRPRDEDRPPRKSFLSLTRP